MKSNAAKFYQLDPAERLAQIAEQTSLTPEQQSALLPHTGLTIEQANDMIENVIGLYSLPVGIAQNFLINGRDVLIPMVVEEPSIVAGASFMAKIIRSGGGFSASSMQPVMIGQMQLLDVHDLDNATRIIEEHKEDLLAQAAVFDPLLIQLGGGPRDIKVRKIEESPIGPFLVLHWWVDVRDAMGANAVNTIVERMSPEIERLTGGRVHLRILTNLADQRLARASCTLPVDALAFGEYTGQQVRDGILEAYAFAVADPYRAATHNKGIMNGIDAVVMATANDWRAIEAGAHAYAARSGRYTSLTTWSKDADGNLHGEIELPMAVGIFGGATRVHPTARVALQILGVNSASEFAQILASVGLAQNLAALRALATEGIQRGHMSLHAKQIALTAGAKPDQVERLTNQLISEKNIRLERALEILQEWSIN